MAQGDYGTSTNPLKQVHGEQWVYTPLTSDPTSSEREEGSTWFRSDLDSGDKIGTLRLQRDDAGNTINDIPVFAEGDTVDGVVKARPIQTPNGEAFIPYVQEGGAFEQYRLQHGGTWYGAHNSLTAAPASGVFRLTFDNADTSGSTSEDSWNDNDATINGATTGVSGANQTYTTNEAYSFDSSNSNYVRLDSAVSISGSHSIAVWVRPGRINFNDFEKMVVHGGSNTDRSLLNGVDGDNKVRFLLNQGGTQTFIDTTTALSQDSWYHVVGVFDSGTMRLYLDSTEEATDSFGEAVSINDRTKMGADTAASSPFYEGDLDDIRLYDKALSDTEVNNLYNNGSI